MILFPGRCRLFVCLYVLCAFAQASPLFTERVNVNPVTGAEDDGGSSQAVISADGCIVAFQSNATTLANPSFGITKNSSPQIYAVNRCVSPHTLELISVSGDGTAAANGYCGYPNVSADGRYVAFYSFASNLAGGATSGTIFIRDRLAQNTSSPLSTWQSTAHITIHDSQPYLSGDANRLVLDFSATGITHNLYVFDRSGSVVTLQPVCPTPAMSSSKPCEYAVISTDGTTVAFDTDYALVPADTNGYDDIYTYNIAGATWQLGSVNSDGTLASGQVGFNGATALNGDGSVAVFHNYDGGSLSGGSRSVLRKSLSDGSIAVVDQNAQGQTLPTDSPATLYVSADGGRVAFTSQSTYPIVHFPSDTIVWDASSRRLISVCRSSSAMYGNSACSNVALSGDGKWATYASYATNLVPGITNTSQNIFVSAVDPALDLIFAADFEQ